MIPIAKPFLNEEEALAAYETILTGWITQGPKVAEFEERFAEYVGAKYAVAVSNCTTGLHLTLMVAGITQGDEVICPSLSYIATANAITYVGATPVFAEVNESYNLDLKDVMGKISSKTKAILLVHQMGMPADLDEFIALCDSKNLILIEDAACAIGSQYKGLKIGAHSDLVCFSFHPRKVITTGDGGMITTNNENYANRIKLLRQHGMSINDRVRHQANQLIFEEHLEIGFNYRMTDIQAAVGIKQLEKLNEIIKIRREIAERFTEALKDIRTIRLPIEEIGYFTNYQSYCIYLTPDFPVKRNELMQLLLDNQISSRRGIMTAHREKAYESYPKVSLPRSEDLSDNSIVIPLYPTMKEDEITHVCKIFKKIALSNISGS